MTAIGATLQLLPVATRQPVGSIAAAKAVWWLLVAGRGPVRRAAPRPTRRARWRRAAALAAVALAALRVAARAQPPRRARHAAWSWRTAGRRSPRSSALPPRASRSSRATSTASSWITRRFAPRTWCSPPTGSWGCSPSACRSSCCRCSPSRARPRRAPPTPRSAPRSSRSCSRSAAYAGAAALTGLAAAVIHIVSLERSLRARLRPVLGAAFCAGARELGAASSRASRSRRRWSSAGRRRAPALCSWCSSCPAGCSRSCSRCCSASCRSSLRCTRAPARRSPRRSARRCRLPRIASCTSPRLAGCSLAVVLDAPRMAQAAAAAGLAGALAFGGFFVGVLLRLRDARAAAPA